MYQYKNNITAVKQCNKKLDGNVIYDCFNLPRSCIETLLFYGVTNKSLK